MRKPGPKRRCRGGRRSICPQKDRLCGGLAGGQSLTFELQIQRHDNRPGQAGHGPFKAGLGKEPRPVTGLDTLLN